MNHKLSTKYAGGGHRCQGYEAGYEPCNDRATKSIKITDKETQEVTLIWFCDYHYVKCSNDIENNTGIPVTKDEVSY
jgi:hypothetical protein